MSDLHLCLTCFCYAVFQSLFSLFACLLSLTKLRNVMSPRPMDRETTPVNQI
uniref:Uncharacterized protein n=1 Tax=Equus caballus TaxID=9796 RepID=A0A3Q2GUN1_HORSE